MEKNEIKKILKPLIKTCIKEVLIEEGVLSSLISEVVKGTQHTQYSSNQQNQKQLQQEQKKQRQAQLQEKHKLMMEQKKKLLDSVGFGVDVFKDTEPLAESQSPAHSALSGVEPGDAGVDISAIMKLGGKSWKTLAEG